MNFDTSHDLQIQYMITIIQDINVKEVIMIIDDYQRCRHVENSSLVELLCNVEKEYQFSSNKEKSEFLILLLEDLKTKDWNEKEENREMNDCFMGVRVVKTQGVSIIKTLGRSLEGSDPIFTKKGIVTLVQLAGLDESSQFKPTPTACEALKCISNCIFLNNDTKTYLEQENIISSCQSILLQFEDQRLDIDFQFLICRILFFMTVDRYDIIQDLIQSNISHSIEKILSENIHQLETPHFRQMIDPSVPINPLTVTSEALKLLFNLMLFDARQNSNEIASEHFKNCLTPIFHLLFKTPYAKTQPLIPPHSQAIHALMQFSYTTIEEVWLAQSEWISQLYDKQKDEHGFQFIVNTLVDVLDRAIHALIPEGDPDQDGVQQIDSIIAPLLLVLTSLAEGNTLLKQLMVEAMLPNEKDRHKPVHEGHSLSAYLIRLMTSTMMPQTRDATCETLFILCDKDANKFTQQVGYGNAIGYLFNKGIPMQPPKREEENGKDINPITGQYMSSEPEKDLKDMTDEEKEREAERLFVLFERLKKTGIIDVENPIAKAMRESDSRFEEIHSESDDE
ncbi:guanine nucleotide exchange factor synembryn-domain-containing protein [Cokeromyces recurvatus]|uniref:guanine nucleotide exchange factor synembryn-domain-containing protein n=1 Tax=Cokeromyces recurvatus TaxID=90255 RepID=UPI0022212087|nr:guanine nucleotide exchange factor synembryn-domain-containing protein [Cokeromyces recurvatus]KAI7902845.1 guanine nucleotide exchange factor synembryn-domain-containing protein [Cokeromyces recurvatus]